MGLLTCTDFKVGSCNPGTGLKFKVDKGCSPVVQTPCDDGKILHQVRLLVLHYRADLEMLLHSARTLLATKESLDI